TNQSHFFNDQERTKRLCPAGPDHAQVAAAQGVGEYFKALCEHHGIGGDDKQQRARALRKLLQGAETAQLETLLDYFTEHPKVRIIGPQIATQRAPTVSILVKGHQPMALSRQLGAQGILCGAGHFYSYRLLDAMGLDPQTGVLRFSMVHYTSQQDVQQLLAAMHRLLV
ncbi:MAG: aminotransferase class V-fold PLP-dependent enzyme, partial [Gammaproteobacteria bacterium]|nr:aminotransferase class V-fold PLP-dependent enzyme [Gammaproteobacteria bacterium]